MADNGASQLFCSPAEGFSAPLAYAVLRDMRSSAHINASYLRPLKMLFITRETFQLLLLHDCPLMIKKRNSILSTAHLPYHAQLRVAKAYYASA